MAAPGAPGCPGCTCWTPQVIVKHAETGVGNCISDLPRDIRDPKRAGISTLPNFAKTLPVLPADPCASSPHPHPEARVSAAPDCARKTGGPRAGVLHAPGLALPSPRRGLSATAGHTVDGLRPSQLCPPWLLLGLSHGSYSSMLDREAFAYTSSSMSLL